MPLPMAELELALTRQRTSEPFSGVVSLRQADTILFERACGDALRAESIPNRVDTRFQIASGCKIFTSVAINQLFEQGRLAPDTLLRDCVGVPLPHFAPDITVHQLLTHTSGVPDYFDEAVMDDFEALWRQQPMYTIRRPADFLPLFQDKPMQSPPGSTFAYNNGGYVLLGLIVEHVTGGPFTEYITENIFRPSGMYDSGYFASNQLPPRTALAYIENADGTWRSNIYAVPIVGGPDGGAYTTAADMAHFWGALSAYKLLSAETTASLLAPQVATGSPPPYDHSGRGVWIEAGSHGIRKYFAEGFDPGVAFRSAVYPSQGLILTMLANTGNTLWPLYRELEALVAPLVQQPE
jgi:CubicO group peptidase (beta-lactamase class C family)